MEKVIAGIVVMAFAFLFFVGWVLALAWPVELLWNGLIPQIFHLPAISYTQALGLMVLSGLLFGKKGSCGGCKK